MRRPIPIKPKSGEESVWDHPRPPRLEHVSKRVQIVFGGTLIVDTDECLRVLDTSILQFTIVLPKPMAKPFKGEPGSQGW